MSHEASNALLQKACSAIEGKRYDDALELVNKVIESDAEYCYAWLYKGVVLEWLERDEDALDCMAKAIRFSTEYYDAYMQMGHIYLKQGKAEMALNSFCSACRVAKSSDSVFWKGHAAYNLGKYAIAGVAFEDVLRMDGSYIEDAQIGLNLIAEIQNDTSDLGGC